MDFKKELTIIELFQELNLNAEKVVVEVNLEIIAKELYLGYKLYETDVIEIISFMGGG